MKINIPHFFGSPKVTISIATMASTVLLSGCLHSKNQPERGFVQREWATSLRELGISPVFPPREDFQVGDIYASSIDLNSLETLDLFEKEWRKLGKKEKRTRLSLGMNTRAYRLDLQKKIHEEYQESITAPRTTPDFNSILGNPATAAAQDKLTKAQDGVKALDAKIQLGVDEEKKAQEKLVKATREKALVDKDVVTKKKYFEDNNADPSSTDESTAEWTAYKAAMDAKVLSSDKLKKAQNLLNSKPDDDAQKKAVAAAKLEDDNNQVDLDRTLANWKIVKKKAYQDALDKQATAQVELTGATEKVEDIKSNTTQAQKDRIAAEGVKPAAETAVTEAKNLLAAITQAGAKLLYQQPTYGYASTYTYDNCIYDPSDNKENDVLIERINRFKLVGFPQFSTVSFRQSDLSALIPIEAMQLGLNVSSETVDTVSVSVPSAESYGLSVGKFRDLLLEDVTAKPAVLNDKIRDAVQFQLLGSTLGGGEEEYNGNKREYQILYLNVITEVFYARALDVGLFSSKAFGVKLQVSDPVSPLVSGDAPVGISEPANIPASSALDGSSAGSSISGIQSRLGVTQKVPGGTVQVLNANESSIGIRRVFDRPIAIGYRGLSVKVKIYDDNPDTSPKIWEVVSVETVSTVTPKSMPEKSILRY